MKNWPFDPALESYVNLATFRRNGREVRTPVWIAGADRLYYLFSEGNAGKVKRIRADGRVRVAACDSRGKVSSEWLDGQGRIVSEPEVIQRAYELLRRKYRWRMRILDFFSKLSGRYQKRAFLEIEIEA